VDGDPLINRS